MRDMVRTWPETTVGRQNGAASEAEPRVRLAGGTPTTPNVGRSRELDFYGAMEPQEMATYYYTGGGRPLFGDPYKQIGERVEAVKAQRLLQEDE